MTASDRFIHDLKSLPNQLTLLRLVFIPFIVMVVLDANYAWALGLFVLAGISDGLDGLLARVLKQKTTLGEYLDPIADKLLLSTLFLVLSFVGKIPWKITILVFSRDFCILLICAVLYIATPLRDYSPSIFGKANTLAQIATLLLVLLAELTPSRWVLASREAGMWVVAVLTLASAVHYIYLVGYRLRQVQNHRPAG